MSTIRNFQIVRQVDELVESATTEEFSVVRYCTRRPVNPQGKVVINDVDLPVMALACG